MPSQASRQGFRRGLSQLLASTGLGEPPPSPPFDINIALSISRMTSNVIVEIKRYEDLKVAVQKKEPGHSPGSF